VNLANGTERNHQPDERVSVAALEGMLDVALALLDAVADLPVPAPASGA
jgi:tripeptide aminopeptidase